MEYIGDKSRIEWLDISKGILMIFVILAHSHLGRMSFIFDNFFMPMFFFLSGYTFKFKSEERIDIFIKKKMKVILIPYMSFSIILFVINFIKYGVNNSFLVNIFGVFYSRYFLYNTKYVDMYSQMKLLSMNNSALWFLTCIFICNLLLYLILKISKSYKIRIMIVILLVSVGIIMNEFFTILMPWSIDTACICIFYMYLGYILKNIDIKDISIKSKYVFYISLILYISLSFINRGVNISIGIYRNYILFIIASLNGILFWIFIAKYIEKNLRYIKKGLIFIGQNSIIILCSHLLILDTLNDMIPTIYINGIILEIIVSTFRSFIIMAITIIIIVPIIYFINEKCRWIIGR